MHHEKAKLAMTSFDIAAILSELQETIIGSRINNIYQVSPVTLLFTFVSDIQLLIELGRRIHFTNYLVKRPARPSQFCRILRKHLRRGIIHELDMPQFERIVIMTVKARRTTYRLVFELFSRGNAILVDDQDTILYASSYRTMRDRAIVRHRQFQLPPPRGLDPTHVTRDDMTSLLHHRGTIIQALTRSLSIGGLYAEELLLRANLDKNLPAGDVTLDDVTRLHHSLGEVLTELGENPHPHIVEATQGHAVDVLPAKLRLYDHCELKPYLSFNEASDAYFTALQFKNDALTSAERDETQRQIDEQQRILRQQRNSLTLFKQTAEDDRHIGDLIYTYIHDLERLCQTAVTILHGRQSAHDKVKAIKAYAISLPPPLTVANVDLATQSLHLTVQDYEIRLHLKQTIYENAANYYNEAKRMRDKIAGVTTSIAETQRTIERLQSQGARAAVKPIPEHPVKQRKRRWYEKFRWTHSQEGFLILGGRDAITNELLIKRHTDPKDLVFHADIPGAPFILVKTNGQTPSTSTLEEAAQCAVAYSAAWRSGYTSLDAYWVTPDQVSKEAPSGEYLTRGAFMIRGKKTYLRNIELRIAIGVRQTAQHWQVIGGPPTAIAAQTPYFVEIIPGKQTSGRLAKVIRHRLSTLVPREVQPRIQRIALEAIQQFLPAGGSDLTEITIKATYRENILE